MIAVVVSRADSASVHIGERLLELEDWEERTDDSRSDADGGGTYYRHADFELREFDAMHLELANVAEAFSADPEFVAFVSRHSGDTGPLLTAHFTGNFGPAEYGGETGRFARACPNAQKAVVEAFDRHAPDAYGVGVECTHHGPTDAGAPAMFVELGSDEAEWDDPAGARAVARSVLALSGVAADRERQLVGFGGGHYAPRFERIVRETDWAVGHIGAEWPLDAMGAPEHNREVIRRAFEASAAEYAVVDGDHPELVSVVEELGYRVVTETWVRETEGVSLDRLASLEADLSSVDEGLRLGARVDDVADGAHVVVSLPDDLLAEAAGIDLDAALAAVHDRAVAYETREGGTKATGRAALPREDDYDAVVDALAAVLREKYDRVSHQQTAVVATREAFDAAAAKSLGVPEGPAFGKLSAGKTVEIDDRTVTPGDVNSEETVVFRI
ncbi:D-aminoacyl-tRNA deacylase [Halogeometricum limi]|uniref:D-aminoacyl-tRNA deacylase n=1 Tax=Halogeometricum limi TaxID=555875 RepID=A0A1I6G5E2_9EURY|nr:D-aminoacyl-tRNA deacylase [Halogeometricum limi]SFR37416.1 D-aminoacyl-tRNA deacylase [Halogeometricum limi]